MKYLNIIENEILDNEAISVNSVEEKGDIYNEIARVMIDKLKENNQKGLKTSFILPVGPRKQYKRFAKICNLEKVSCKNLIAIIMDEYIDNNGSLISKENPLSFRGFLERELFDLLDHDLKVDPEKIFNPDPEKLSQVGKIIKEIGGADICFGGIGINGHIAFNEPIDDSDIMADEFLQLKTRVLGLSRETKVINSIKYGGDIDIIPDRCITIGMAEIFTSKELRFYLEHNWQSAVLRKIILEKPTPSFPATFLKLHENASITVSENVLKDYIDFDIQ